MSSSNNDQIREPANWTAMVLLSDKKRVRHLAIFAPTAAPLCRNRGEFPHFGYIHDFPGVPICTRCRDELSLLYVAVWNTERGDAS